jgi:hypothetical protein
MNVRIETAYDDEYATCVKTHAWLRIMSEQLDSDTVTTSLALQPTRTIRRGDLPRPDSKHPYKYSGWFLESENHVQSRDARRHLDWIIDQLRGKSAAIAMLQSEGHLIDLCVLWDSGGQGGPTLSPNQMGPLADLGIELFFDIYFAGDDDAV